MTQKEDIKKSIRTTAEGIVKKEDAKGHDNVTYEQRIKDYETLLTSLCEMYSIAYA